MPSVNNYPTALNNFTGSETLGNAHSSVHNALEAKIGIGASTPTAGYALTGTGPGSSAWSTFIPAGNLVTDISVNTLINKTWGSPTYAGFGGDALGDIWYNETGNLVTRLPIGNLNDVLTVDATGRPTWQPGAGAGAVLSVNTLAGNLTIAGTANQVNVVSGGTTITLSTPQDIATSSSPTFASINISGLSPNLGVFTNAGSQLTTTGTLLEGQGGTGENTYTIGDILYSDAPNSLTKLAIGSAGQVLTVVAGIPAWAGGGGGGAVSSVNALTGALTIAGTANRINVVSGGTTITLSTPQDIATTSAPTFSTIKATSLATNSPVFTDGLNNLTTNGIVPELKGGTNQNSYLTGDILYASAANTLSKLSAGIAGQVLTMTAGVPAWQNASGGGFSSGFRATKTGAQVVLSGATNTITTWTTVYDGLGEFNAATGVFTAAAAGRYLVELQIVLGYAGAAGVAVCLIPKNGANLLDGNFFTNAAAIGLVRNVSGIVNLVAGDTLRFDLQATFTNITVLDIVGTIPTQFAIQRLA